MAPVVRIVQLRPAVLAALAKEDLVTANQLSTVPLNAYLVGEESLSTWRRRAKQVIDDPSSEAWITGVIIDDDQQWSVGRAGFHGPPDENGMVELGYAVDPAFRRQGYARAAFATLLERAGREPGVRTFRASVSPTNVASKSLIESFGLVHVGELMDDEDGLELIYELGLSS